MSQNLYWSPVRHENCLSTRIKLILEKRHMGPLLTTGFVILNIDDSEYLIGIKDSLNDTEQEKEIEAMIQGITEHGEIELRLE